MTHAFSPRRRAAGRRSCTALVHASAALGLVAILPAAIHVAHGQDLRPAAGPPARRTIVDPAVVPAGGCRGCNAASCRGCRAGHGGHHAGCRDGACHPHCPVRPQEFGFYGTQWRRWPDTRIVPVSNQEAVTPVTPPRSQVPRSEDESRRVPGPTAAPEPLPSRDDADPAPVDAAAPTPQAEPAADPPRGDLTPRGDTEPVPPAEERTPRPRLLPQSMNGDDSRSIELPGRAPGERNRTAGPIDPSSPTDTNADSDSDPNTDTETVEAIAPEPESRVVPAAAEAEEEPDEASIGPARRRFVARRAPTARAAAGAADDREASR